MATFDPAAATAAYLAELSPAQHALASAYTQGGHWLLLWGFLVSAVSAWIIVRLGVLQQISGALQKNRPHPWLAAFLCAVVFLLLDTLIELPWAAYSGWWRETQYHLTSQSFGGWLGDAAKSAAIGALLGGVFLMVVYAIIRASKQRWWLWASGFAAVAFLFLQVISPIFIEPLFNKFTPAPAGPVRDEVVAMAKANGVPSDKIYIYDGSKQSNRYTANVAGLFGTARVAMSDVMFKKGADLAQVRGVVGHEMGHYVHQHALWLTLGLTLVAMITFGLGNLLFPFAARLLGASKLSGIADPAGLPVLVVVLGFVSLLMTPVQNTIIRAAESDADSYSLQHENEPDGLSRGLVKTIEYRAATPGKLEETIFYDHPSVGSRIRKAMDWKAAHMKDAAPPPAPAPPAK